MQWTVPTDPRQINTGYRRPPGKPCQAPCKPHPSVSCSPHPPSCRTQTCHPPRSCQTAQQAAPALPWFPQWTHSLPDRPAFETPDSVFLSDIPIRSYPAPPFPFTARSTPTVRHPLFTVKYVQKQAFLYGNAEAFFTMPEAMPFATRQALPQYFCPFFPCPFPRFSSRPGKTEAPAVHAPEAERLPEAPAEATLFRPDAQFQMPG